MFNKYLKLIFSFIFVSSISLAVFAANPLNCLAGSARQDFETQVNKVAEPSWGAKPSANAMSGLIYYIVNAFLGLLGIIFLILIIYAGFNWMTAQGDEEKVTLAKNTLTRAVIGLAIIILAYAITFFVFSSLPAGEGTGTGNTPSTTNSGD